MAGALLCRSGTYSAVVDSWPPPGVARTPAGISAWLDDLRKTASAWRSNAISESVPDGQIADHWLRITTSAEAPVAAILDDPDLTLALLLLVILADEACRGVGFSPAADPFERRILDEILVPRQPGGSTLCRRVPRSILRVLPKQHTPQSGLSFRSLTHHLALCQSGDLDVGWKFLPTRPGPGREFLNVLLVPWPYTMKTSQFRVADPENGGLETMPPCYGFFDYQTGDCTNVANVVENLIAHAEEEIGGMIHGVVLPELALPEHAHRALRDTVLRRGAFLIAGVLRDGHSTGTIAENYVAVDGPIGTEAKVSIEQRKHHRWRLNQSQIEQYDLGFALDPKKYWWERILTGHRQLSFFVLTRWLTVCALVCEDLAQQEPVAEVVRAVGPNLVVAVLMDGPQLGTRWPARYATVLADDPGCSVLTLTSLGMASASRPKGGLPGSRTIALWKDAYEGSLQEIVCPAGKAGVVLCLTSERTEEWTADGRGDGRLTSFPVLSSQHPVG